MFCPWCGPGMGWANWLVGGVIVLLIFGTLAVLGGLAIWAVLRSSRGSGPRRAEPHTPLQVPQERYARGEITREEFDEIRRDLQD